MAITHLDLASVSVADQDRARAFYVDGLGFALVRDNPYGEGMRWIRVAPPGAATSVALVTWFPTMPPGSVKGLVLACDDVDATYEELARRGVPFAGPIQEAPWGRFATFDDPDGNGWVLQG